MSVSTEVDSEESRDQFLGLSETGSYCEPMLNSESTVNLPNYTTNYNSVPMHVSLNQTLQVLKRATFPKTLSKQFLRCFQNFSASNPEDVVSFLQVEALMRQSLFFGNKLTAAFLGQYIIFNTAISNLITS